MQAQRGGGGIVPASSPPRH